MAGDGPAATILVHDVESLDVAEASTPASQVLKPNLKYLPLIIQEF
jgi:hypothetical protein